MSWSQPWSWVVTTRRAALISEQRHERAMPRTRHRARADWRRVHPVDELAAAHRGRQIDAGQPSVRTPRRLSRAERVQPGIEAALHRSATRPAGGVRGRGLRQLRA